jgi:DinB family protein
MTRPAATEYAPYYGKYVTLVPEDDVVAVLEDQANDALALLRLVPDPVGDEVHPPYTWSVKQVVCHVADSERVFAYRALRFSRRDVTPLAGFDESAYAKAVPLERVRLGDLVAEFDAVRRSSLWLFKNMPADAWDQRGDANAVPVSVRALAYIIAGHARHHTAILKQRLSGVRGPAGRPGA